LSIFINAHFLIATISHGIEIRHCNVIYQKYIMVNYREVSKVSGYGLDSTQLRTDTCVTSLCPCVLSAVCIQPSSGAHKQQTTSAQCAQCLVLSFCVCLLDSVKLWIIGVDKRSVREKNYFFSAYKKTVQKFQWMIFTNGFTTT
jgi:hypothetical protein